MPAIVVARTSYTTQWDTILEENFAAQPVALSTFKGKPAGLACLNAFATVARAELMQAAISRSGLVGITVPRNP